MKRKIVTGDCESDPFKIGRIPKPFIWCIFDGEEYYLFNTAYEMVEFLKDKNWIVYFHNGGKFDYFYMLDYLEPFDYILNINGRLSQFTIGKCEFRDSMNILPVALAKYKKDDFDYSKMEKNVRYKFMPEIIKYLKNDCKFLYELVDAFIGEYGVNLTLASSAFKFFNKNIRKLPTLKTNKLFYDEMKQYYYGGRVECFKKGIINHEVKCYDINSAYPTAMMQEHPYGDSYIISDKLPDKKIGQCFITLKCISKGAFPFRSDDKSLNFPNDEIIREYHVTGWEYLTAKKLNKIINEEIIEVYIFSQSITFVDYIKHFYEIKQNADPTSAEYLIAKLFLNSLYGKYASNPDKYRECYICPMDKINFSCEFLEMEFAGELGKWAMLEGDLPEEKQNYYNVATASSITGWVRAYLFENLCKAENIVYCDTDSIFCENAPEIKLSKELGDWGIDGEFKIGGGIGGKKLYAFEFKKPKGEKTHKIASKGAKLTPDEILEICQGAEITYKSISPQYSLKNGIKFIDRKIKMT